MVLVKGNHCSLFKKVGYKLEQFFYIFGRKMFANLANSGPHCSNSYVYKNRNCTECRKNYLSLEKCAEKIDIKEGKHYLLRDRTAYQVLLRTYRQ